MELLDRLLIILSLEPKGCRRDRSPRCCLMGSTTKAPRSQSCLLSAQRSWGRFFRRMWPKSGSFFLASWIRDLGKTSHKEKILLGIPQISSPAPCSLHAFWATFSKFCQNKITCCTANVCSMKWMRRKKKLNCARCPISVMVDCCCKINGSNDCGNSDLDLYWLQ